MRIHSLLIALTTACGAPAPTPVSPAPPSTPQAQAPTTAPAPAAITWMQIWRGDVRKVSGLWTSPSLHQQDTGAKLTLDVAIAVGSVNDLTAADVAVELYAGTRRLVCGAPDPMGFTQTRAITAQASVQCENPARELPTRIVVAVRGVRETFDFQLASLTTPI